MKRMFFIILFTACISVFSVFAQQGLTVSYVEGEVETVGHGALKVLYIGDLIPRTATVRVGPNGYIELNEGSVTVRITRPGTYVLSSLVSAAQENQSVNLGSVLQKRIRTITRDEAPTTTTVAGVRASEAVTAPEISWAGVDDVAEMLEEGIEYLTAGEYGPAYFIFEDLHDYAAGAEADMVQFYLGYTAYLLGRAGEALSLLETLRKDTFAEYYDDHILTLGQILFETFAYSEAIALLSPYVEGRRSDAENKQTAHLLLGLSYRGIKDRVNARLHLSAAEKIDPGSDAGIIANNLLVSVM